MKLSTLIYPIFFISFVLITGCKKDFLETKPTDSVPTEVVFETTDGAYVALNGIHRFMYSFAVGNPEVGGHDDFGQKSNDLAADLLGEDMPLLPPAVYGWFNREYNYVNVKDVTPTRRPRLLWYFYYQIINNANAIINNIDAAKGSQEDKDYIKGQALFYRAFSYYNLSVYYAHTYVGHQNDKCVPIYTETTTSSTKGNPRATVEQVYDLITSDLESAIALLGPGGTRTDKSQIDGSTARGLYARVALVMNDWTKARQYANEARAGYTIMNAQQYGQGFNNIANPEVIWGSAINSEQNTVLASLFSHFDLNSGGYASFGMIKLISQALYEQMDDDDVRKSLFTPPGDEEYPPYSQFKFRLRTPGSWVADYIYMRAAEMVLIEAEAAARQGDDGTAQTLLESLVKERFPAYTAPSGGQALLDEILLQRRIELWGEGFRYFDIKRLKIPLNRNGSNHTASMAIVMDLPAESDKFLFVIPQEELDANQSLTAADQNPL